MKRKEQEKRKKGDSEIEKRERERASCVCARMPAGENRKKKEKKVGHAGPAGANDFLPTQQHSRFDVAFKVDGIVRLHANHQLVQRRLLAKHGGGARRGLELDANVAFPLVQRLARLHDERHARPARVVDLKLGQRVCRRDGPLGHCVVVQVARPGIAGHVLSQHDVLEPQRRDAAQRLDFFVAHKVGVAIPRDADGGLHGDERQDLKR